MPASTTTAVRTITISPLNVATGQRLRVNVFVQGNNVVFVDGGSGTPTLDTVTAGSKLFREYVWNGTNWEIYQ